LCARTGSLACVGLSSAQQLQAARKRLHPLLRTGKAEAFDRLGREIARGELRLIGGKIMQATGKLREWNDDLASARG
jgi:hypothetical protein